MQRVSGDTDLQTAIESIDTLLDGILDGDPVSGTFNLTLTSGIHGVVVVKCGYSLLNGYATITMADFTSTIVGVPPPYGEGIPDAAFAAAGLVPASNRKFAVHMSSTSVPEDIFELILDNNAAVGRFRWLPGVSGSIQPADTFTPQGQVTITYKVADQT
jgi:hypothetical protein